MRSKRMEWAAFLGLVLVLGGCGGSDSNSGESGGAPNPGGDDGSGQSQDSSSADPSSNGDDSDAAAGAGATTTGGGDSDSSADTGGGEDAPGAGASGAGGSDSEPAASAAEQLDPEVDWTALTLVYPTMYSAYDGMHTFQVPVHVDGTNVELSGWSSIPAGAVTIEPDPDVEGGVMLTIESDVPEITIAAQVQSAKIGGTATLHVTSATPEQWEMGKARYANGVEFDLPMITPEDFANMLLDPNWEPPPPPGDLACNNCHTTGAKYFEIQHTPTQAARFSDDDLRTIFSEGKKPEGVGFRVLPDMLGEKTDEELYAEFHHWESTEEEQKGLIVYLRSLTPEGQGDILLPDGTYVAPGERPPGFEDFQP